jgi:hypothetical protein
MNAPWEITLDKRFQNRCIKTYLMNWKYKIRKVGNVSAVQKYYIALDHRQHSYRQV